MKDLIKTIDRLEKKRMQLDIEIKNKIELLRSICPHTNIREEYKATEAGYDYVATYTTKFYCNDCGLKVKEEVEYGNSYG